jgi:hypothetical protein
MILNELAELLRKLMMIQCNRSKMFVYDYWMSFLMDRHSLT